MSLSISAALFVKRSHGALADIRLHFLTLYVIEQSRIEFMKGESLCFIANLSNHSSIVFRVSVVDKSVLTVNVEVNSLSSWKDKVTRFRREQGLSSVSPQH